MFVVTGFESFDTRKESDQVEEYTAELLLWISYMCLLC